MSNTLPDFTGVVEHEGRFFNTYSDGTVLPVIAGGSEDGDAPKQPPAATGVKTFTEEELREAQEKAREQEKNKLYGRMDTLQKELEDLRKADAERAAQDEQRKRDAEAKVAEEQRRKQAEELDAKDLILAREREMEQRLEQQRQEFELRMAAMEKDREVQALAAYIQRRVREEADDIAPELIDFVGGNNEAEVEASIATIKAKSAAILENARAALTQARTQMPGVSTYTPTGPTEADTGQRQLTPEAIRDMPLDEYAALRQKLGMDNSSGNRGMFG